MSNKKAGKFKSCIDCESEAGILFDLRGNVLYIEK